jgi:hypothetical protein
MNSQVDANEFSRGNETGLAKLNGKITAGCKPIRVSVI